MQPFHEEYKNAKVLVTGAGGFIGGQLVTRLVQAGAKTTALLRYNSERRMGPVLSDFGDHDNLQLVYGDITDYDFVYDLIEQNKFDYIFHLAALISIPYSYDSPRSYVSTNIVGSQNIFDAAGRNGVRRIVHTSTSEVYGTALYTPIDEKHPLQAQSPYSATKISADMLADSYYRSFGTPVIIIRPFNTFGPYQSQRAVIPTVIAQVASGANELKLGDLSPVRDFNYVSNTIDGFLAGGLCKDECLGDAFNLATNRGITIGDMVKEVVKISGKDVSIVTDPQRLRPQKSEVFELLGNFEKAKDMLGWEPSVSFEEGLEKSFRHISNNLDRYRSDEYHK